MRAAEGEPGKPVDRGRELTGDLGETGDMGALTDGCHVSSSATRPDGLPGPASARHHQSQAKLIECYRLVLKCKGKSAELGQGGLCVWIVMPTCC